MSCTYECWSAFNGCLVSSLIYNLCTLVSCVCVCVSGCVGVLSVIGTAEIEVAESSHAGGTAEEGGGVESLPFEFECLRPPKGCPEGQIASENVPREGQTASENVPRICYGK